MKAWLARYIRENFNELLALDLSLARLLGAPAPHTLSSYAYVHSKFWTKIIDFLAWWIMDEKDHCHRDFMRVMEIK
jgi:hypothetical protein